MKSLLRLILGRPIKVKVVSITGDSYKYNYWVPLWSRVDTKRIRKEAQQNAPWFIHHIKIIDK